MTSMPVPLAVAGARPALLPPLAVILVAPKGLLQNGVDDMVRAALDELRVVIEQHAHRLLHAYFPG